MRYLRPVNHLWGRVTLLILSAGLFPFAATCQIDPVNRELFEAGYNAPLEGQWPVEGYVFYYRNMPDFLDHTNLTLRLVVAPTYLESELGFKSLLGENTDLGLGVEGGGFDDSFYYIRRGTYDPGKSFDGYGAETDVSLYHLFNPGQRIPLNGVLRGGVRYSTYAPTSQTYSGFDVPPTARDLRGAHRSALRGAGAGAVLAPGHGNVGLV